MDQLQALTITVYIISFRLPICISSKTSGRATAHGRCLEIDLWIRFGAGGVGAKICESKISCSKDHKTESLVTVCRNDLSARLALERCFCAFQLKRHLRTVGV